MSGYTNFANPLRFLKDVIIKDGIKELLVVFLTDGLDRFPDETKVASLELKNALDRVYSKFNVIGFGRNFDVEILNFLVSSGTQLGIVSGDPD